VRQVRGRRVGGQRHGEGVAGAALDRADDEIACRRDILFFLGRFVSSQRWLEGSGGRDVRGRAGRLG
jgi:hypothetical protein